MIDSVVIIFYGNKIGDKTAPQNNTLSNDSAKLHIFAEITKNSLFFH